MLIRSRVANFRSFREPQEFSLVATSLDGHPESVVQAGDLSLLKAAAVYGANASGKTNLLRALEFLSSAVRHSHRSWPPEGPIPAEPFLFSPEAATAPSLFEIDFLLEGVRYTYGFVLDRERVLEEWLDAYPNRRRQSWFTRDAARTPEFEFGAKLPGENRAIEALTRPNSLFLSAAAQNNHPMLTPVYLWLAEQIEFPTLTPDAVQSTIARLCRDADTRALLARALSRADFGISGIALREQQRLVTLSSMLSVTRWDTLGGWGGFHLPDPPPRTELFHRAPSGDEIALPLDQESSGTEAYLALLALTLDARRRGAVLCIDELDRSLHPTLAAEIVKSFYDPDLNPHGAQLIFNTHDTTLLSSDILRRDQVWFTEKDDEGASHLYPLTQFQPRKGENLGRGYLQGRYGAIPYIERGCILSPEPKPEEVGAVMPGEHEQA